MDAAETEYLAAKKFLIGKVVEQATLDGINLSSDEKAMLAFSEEDGTPIDEEMVERFDTTHDSESYEAKIALLIKRAWIRDRTAGKLKGWQQSFKAIRDRDFYLLVMLDQSGIAAE